MALIRFEGEPVPLRRLAFIGLAKGGSRNQAAPLLEALLPEFGRDLVIAQPSRSSRKPQLRITSSRSPSLLSLMIGAMCPGKIAGSGSNAAMRLSDRPNFRASAARLVLTE
jgi:hypothetical protein